MLPGLRFLFAATLMTISLLIFGMGAIALLRASHQQFASLPPLQPPEPVFAQAPATVPSLSMLRADPAPAAPPLADFVQPQREASLITAERPAESPLPLPPSAGEIATPAPSAEAAAPNPEPSPAPQVDQSVTVPAVEQQAALAAPSGSVAETTTLPDKVVEPPVQDSPPRTEAASPTRQIAAVASEPAPPETTGSVTPPDPQPVAATAIADPPLPQARPEVAGLSQAAAKAAITTPEALKKAAAKRKVRHVKRAAPKVEKLPATTSAPSIGSFSSLFGGNNQ